MSATSRLRTAARDASESVTAEHIPLVLVLWALFAAVASLALALL